MSRTSGENRSLLQEIYLQDLVLALYRAYLPRLSDGGGRRLLQAYVRAEEDRRGRIERFLAGRGAAPPAALRSCFAAAGTLYGRITSRLGTRIMLRIALSASRRAARRACAGLGAQARSELLYFATLRARNEGDLLDSLRQHLIDTRPR